MPTLLINLSDVRCNLAEKHSLLTSEIKIVHADGSVVPDEAPRQFAQIYEHKTADVVEMRNQLQIFTNEINSAVRSGDYVIQNKIAAIKAIRTLTGLGLKEAKDLVEALHLVRY